MAMMLIIVGAMLLTGLFALFVARNVDHGEARFGPDGQLPPYDPEAKDKADRKVTIKQDDTSE
ncbi:MULTISPECIES: hypothetical protein [unclassified Erythrobacter]|jgi:hypothetical protein|uniref:hypothetical protein n=1 Tax=unclassified Erythrobacter TaxID=2633097 RepID=UPI00076D2F37|nr:MULTISPECIES: hypothetical protein [unclassified Erythrobacter]KWV92594.1 hypothetical protein ASS64_15260 [Erythrobacter sp. AP23]MBO6525709.1 hypothetical protein [Erythrobacter sp.]MBO6529617.1 hypothetical protein [Erythrobacter sp.]MBO6769359.1 hypothetical protein [Erythrobacter sp.]